MVLLMVNFLLTKTQKTVELAQNEKLFNSIYKEE